MVFTLQDKHTKRWTHAFPQEKNLPQKKQNRTWPNTLELADHKRALRYQGTKGYQGCKVLWVIWSLLRAAISGLNGEALGSFRAMNHTYVAEIEQQDPSKTCHELHYFQSGHHFCEKKQMIIPWIPFKDNHCWALLHYTDMVSITVPVNWRIMRLEKSLSGEIYGQFSIGAQTCQFLEPPSAQENKMVNIPNK